MASVPVAASDPMVTVKVFYEGLTRRSKMPLRDMVPEALEQSVSCMQRHNEAQPY